MSLYTGSVISWKTLRWFFSHHYISSYKDTLYWGPTVSAADNLWVEVIKKTAYTKNWLSQTCRLCWKERVITYFQVLQLGTVKRAKQRKNTQLNRYIYISVCMFSSINDCISGYVTSIRFIYICIYKYHSKWKLQRRRAYWVYTHLTIQSIVWSFVTFCH